MAQEHRTSYPTALAQDIANYLVTRPYLEVVSLIEGMKNFGVEVLPEPKPEPKPAPEARPQPPAPMKDTGN